MAEFEQTTLRRLTRLEQQVEMQAPTKLWPVGSIFLSANNTNPATLLGFGTWSAFGAGRILVGLDAGDANFDTVEEAGGAKTLVTNTPLEAGVLPPYITVRMWKRTA